MISFKKRVRYIAGMSFAFLFVCNVFAQQVNQDVLLEQVGNLLIGANDIRLEAAEDGGYNLYIRQKSGLRSVLLTETTKDPLGNATNYTYRASEWNPVNGDEIRLLDGEILQSQYSLYSIVDSTPQSDSEFGNAFQLYIPQVLLYGYPWSRNGEETVGIGTFINIRGFSKPFADYTGSYYDNPFMFDFLPPEKSDTDNEVINQLTDFYDPGAARAFGEIASGRMIYSRGPDTIVDDIMNSFRELSDDKPIDVVFAIDATSSMRDDINRLQEELIPALADELGERQDVRLGLLFYRDFGDNFQYLNLPVQVNAFTNDRSVFFEKLNAMQIKEGMIIGGDVPEAVYEALYASLRYYDWNVAAQRKIILIGDAEPHATPRGIYGKSKDDVESLAKVMGVIIDCIITPAK
ncbi:MAG: VWA domain-containing protein [Spirochaetales bacterium]